MSGWYETYRWERWDTGLGDTVTRWVITWIPKSDSSASRGACSAMPRQSVVLACADGWYAEHITLEVIE